MATVLVLEDEAGVRELFALVLRQHGHTVLEARIAEEAERISGEHKIDALVANVALPGGKSGTAFAIELLQSYPHMRVLFVSGWPNRGEEAERMASMPPHSFRMLQKPFGIDELVRQVGTLLSGYGAA